MEMVISTRGRTWSETWDWKVDPGHSAPDAVPISICDTGPWTGHVHTALASALRAYFPSREQRALLSTEMLAASTLISEMDLKQAGLQVGGSVTLNLCS